MSLQMAPSFLLLVIVCLAQALTETATTSDDHLHTLEKRNVGVLARTGQLPSAYQQGKRYLASLARSNNLPVYNMEKKLHPGMTSRNQQETQLEPDEKRYMGALVRTGSLPFQFHTKRDNDQESGDEEELEKLKSLEAETKALETVLYLESQLNLELLKEKLLDGAVRGEEETGGDEKRSMASLARGGNLPVRDEKRSVAALARSGYLPATPRTMAARNDNTEDEVGKRSVATLARNGQLRGYQEGKRGGIGSLARSGQLLPKHKDSDNVEELEELIEDLLEEEKEKKNIGSIARGFNLPSYGKRNLGSLARGGGYARYAKSEDDYVNQDDKRNLASLARSRTTPLHEGKRYLGSLARSQSMPFLKFEEKRKAPLALARYWSKPINMDVFDKRYLPFEDFQGDANVREIAKRYVAALLRQGRLPVNTDDVAEEKEDEKRHIGSAKSAASVSKRSIEITPHDEHGKAVGGRSKREAYLMPASDEYTVPNVQNSELFDYDDLMEVMTGVAAPEKRFLGSVARSGWFREPSRGRSRGGGLVGKRHIGAMARMGWLPQLRSSRYRRFGRAMPSRVCKRSTITDSREDPADGSPAQDDASALWTSSTDAEGRRVLGAATLSRDTPLWKRYLDYPFRQFKY